MIALGRAVGDTIGTPLAMWSRVGSQSRQMMTVSSLYHPWFGTKL